MKLIFILLSINLYANYSPKPQVNNCLTLSANKLIVPPEAAMTVSKTCVTEPCFLIPTEFSCIYFKVEPKSTVTTCTVIPPEPPADPSPTEPLPPVVPQCDSIFCSQGQVRTATDISVTCSWEELVLDTAKKATYDTQKASAEATATVYQESQLYNNIQDYCFYTTGLACPAMPPATFNATAASFSYLTGKPLAEIKKLMKKKVKK